jgi:hypothetical protein
MRTSRVTTIKHLVLSVGKRVLCRTFHTGWRLAKERAWTEKQIRNAQELFQEIKDDYTQDTRNIKLFQNSADTQKWDVTMLTLALSANSVKEALARAPMQSNDDECAEFMIGLDTDAFSKLFRAGVLKNNMRNTFLSCRADVYSAVSVMRIIRNYLAHGDLSLEEDGISHAVYQSLSLFCCAALRTLARVDADEHYIVTVNEMISDATSSSSPRLDPNSTPPRSRAAASDAKFFNQFGTSSSSAASTTCSASKAGDGPNSAVPFQRRQDDSQTENDPSHLTVDEVCVRLVKLGMQQHVVKFKECAIDGSMFAYLDELWEELGVSLAAHRIKIQKVLPSMRC